MKERSSISAGSRLINGIVDMPELTNVFLVRAPLKVA